MRYTNRVDNKQTTPYFTYLKWSKHLQYFLKEAALILLNATETTYKNSCVGVLIDRLYFRHQRFSLPFFVVQILQCTVIMC